MQQQWKRVINIALLLMYFVLPSIVHQQSLHTFSTNAKCWKGCNETVRIQTADYSGGQRCLSVQSFWLDWKHCSLGQVAFEIKQRLFLSHWLESILYDITLPPTVSCWAGLYITYIISNMWKYMCRVKSRNLNCWVKRYFEFINLKKLSNFFFGEYNKFIFPMAAFSHSFNNTVLSDFVCVLIMWIKEKRNFFSLYFYWGWTWYHILKVCIQCDI